MTLQDDIRGLLVAGVPLINLVTYEEDRVVRALQDIAITPPLAIYTWDLADGFRTVREGSPALPSKDVTTDTLLPYLVEKMPARCVVVLKDFHHSWNKNKALVTRKLRNMVPVLRDKAQFLLMVTPVPELPVELKDDVFVLYPSLPEQDDVRRLFDEVAQRLDRAQLPAPAVKERLVSAALGLTTNQARIAFARAYSRFAAFDDRAIPIVTESKRAVIRESGALEFWPADAGVAVGGLDLLKAWLAKREQGFTSDARAAGVPYPRGVALIGIPGTGKSLSAKMLAGMWKLPLLRLDVGAVFGSLLGESEANVRKALQLAELVSPSILWIDEMEKAFAGAAAGSSGLSSGAATRVFGSVLTWMQEHQTPVFVIATANDVGALPPELMSRFERVFFLDLPNDVERREILLIHLRSAGVPFPERGLRMDDLMELTRGLVGREIEYAVREAQFSAFADDNREMQMDDLRKAITEVIPLGRSHVEVIEKLRLWKTEGRAFPASSEEKRPAAARGRSLDLG